MYLLLTHAEKIELAEALVTRVSNGELTEVLFEYDLRRLGLDADDYRFYRDRGREHLLAKRLDISKATRARDTRDKAWLEDYRSRGNVHTRRLAED